MAVNYDKLWSLLIQKGMTRTELCESTGITTNTMARMGKNESVQVEVLGKICVALGCKLDDIVDFDGKCEKYKPVPNIDLTALDSCDEYEKLGYEQLYDFPHPVTRTSIQEHLAECIESCKLTRVACDELLAKLQEKRVSVKLPQNIIPNPALLPHKFSHLEDEEDEDWDDLEHTQIKNYLSWAFDKRLSDGIDLSSVETIPHDGRYLIERGFARLDSSMEGYRFEAVKQTPADSASIYPLNLMLCVFGVMHCDILECCLEDLKMRVNQAIDTLAKREALVLRLCYQKGYFPETICSYFNFPNMDTITEGVTYILDRALRKMRHLRRLNNYITFLFPSKFLIDCATYVENNYSMLRIVSIPE